MCTCLHHLPLLTLRTLLETAARWRLDGYRVLVTGGTKGIGLATAHELASLGATVFVSARTAADVDATVAALTSAHPHNPAHGFAADVGCAASLPSPLLTALLSTHLSAPQLLWLAAARSEQPQRCVHPLSTLSRLPKRSERRSTALAFSCFSDPPAPSPPLQHVGGQGSADGRRGGRMGRPRLPGAPPEVPQQGNGDKQLFSHA